MQNEPNITLQQIAEDFQRYVSVKQDSKKLKNMVLLTSEKYATIRNKQSLPLKAINQRTSKSIPPHVPDVELYTGTKIVLSGIRNVLYVTELDIKAHIADLKTK